MHLPAWLTWGQLRAVLERGRRIAELDKRVSALEQTIARHAEQLAEMQRHAAARPAGLHINDGVYWGRIGDDPELHPFCPACAAAEKWSLLSRTKTSDGRPYYHCGGCKQYLERKE